MQRPGHHLRAHLLHAAIAALCAASLAACGHSGAPASSDAADTNAMIAASGPDHTADAAREDPLRVPVDGTLHYTVLLTGELHTTGKHEGEHRDAIILRKFDITTRVHAVLGNGPLAEANKDHPKDPKHSERPPTRLDDLAKQGEACNGDATCMMKISMQLMADKKAQKEVEDIGRQMTAMIGRTAVYSQRAPCEGRASIDDSEDRATWWEDAGEGYYKTGLDKRKTLAQADASFDCKPHLFSDDPEVAKHLIAEGTVLYLDKQTGEYDLTVAPQQVEVAPTVNGKPAAARKLGIPKVVLTGFKGDGIDKPLRGSKSVDVATEDGIPLRAEVAWTFTPDRS